MEEWAHGAIDTSIEQCEFFIIPITKMRFGVPNLKIFPGAAQPWWAAPGAPTARHSHTARPFLNLGVCQI